MTSQLTAISDTVSGSHANWARAPPIMHRKYNLSVSQKSASINASSMAVLSAGLSCRCTLVSACCVAVVDRDRRRTGRLNFVTEPTAQEESKSASQWLFAFAFFGRDPLQESGQTEPDVGVESVLCEASGGFSEEQVSLWQASGCFVSTSHIQTLPPPDRHGLRGSARSGQGDV